MAGTPIHIDPVTGAVTSASGGPVSAHVDPVTGATVYHPARVPVRSTRGVSGPAPSGIVKNPALAGTPIGNAIAGKRPINVRATQQFLVGQGYNIPVDGQMGPLTKAAIADFHLAPKARNSKAFNQKYGLAPGGKRTSIVDRPINQLLTKKGTPTPAYSRAILDPTPNPDTGGRPIDLSGLGTLAKLAGANGVMVPTTLLSKLDPNTYQAIPETSADAIAGMQFDPQIHELGVQKSQATAQGAQDLKDIQHWYDQIVGEQGTAAQRDKAAEQAGIGSMQDAAKAILASIGGGDSTAAGAVGGAGADAVGTLQALAQNNDQFNNDLAPLLAAEGTEAKTRQTGANAKAIQDLNAQIADALGQRGQAKTTALDQIRQQNNAGAQTDFGNQVSLAQAKAGILGQNNGTRQQTFQDKLALEQAKEAAMLTGAQIMGVGRYAPHASSSVQKPGANLPKGAFINATQGQKSAVAKTIAQTLFDQNGKLKPGMTPTHARALALGIIRQAGWHPLANAATRSWAQGVLKSLGI